MSETENIVAACTVCGSSLYEGESAFGLSAGTILRETDGFAPADFCPWDEVLCIECMDAVDKALLQVREQLQILGVKQQERMRKQ